MTRTSNGANAPLGIRLFGFGGHLAELIDVFRDAKGDPALIEALNRDFGNLREMLGKTAAENCNKICWNRS